MLMGYLLLLSHKFSAIVQLFVISLFQKGKYLIEIEIEAITCKLIAIIVEECVSELQLREFAPR